jgi:hypothetical protein
MTETLNVLTDLTVLDINKSVVKTKKDKKVKEKLASK